MNPWDRQVGNKLRCKRELMRMSQNDVAQALGFAVDDLGAIEDGSARASPVQMEALCRLLSITQAELYADPTGSRSGESA